jgi:UDP-glucuronate 4-epimerase
VRTVLVTGAAGFIGSRVCEALLRRGDRVRGLDSFDGAYDPALKRRNVDEVREAGDLEVLEGDVRDAARVREALAGCDAVVHLAARVGVRPSLLDPVGYADVNVGGTAVVLGEAIRAGARTFVAASSSSVYGARTGAPFSEKDPCDRPISPYAASKRAMERLCAERQAASGIDLACLRFFTTYGPRQRPEMAIHAFVRGIEEGRPIAVHGDGGASRDYTCVDDVAEGVVRALDRSKGLRTWNIGGSRPVSLSDLVAALEAATGRKAAVERLPDQSGDVPWTCADVSLAKAELGWEPRTSLEEGLRRFVAWYRARR